MISELHRTMDSHGCGLRCSAVFIRGFFLSLGVFMRCPSSSKFLSSHDFHSPSIFYYILIYVSFM